MAFLTVLALATAAATLLRLRHVHRIRARATREAALYRRLVSRLDRLAADTRSADPTDALSTQIIDEIDAFRRAREDETIPALAPPTYSRHRINNPPRAPRT